MFLVRCLNKMIFKFNFVVSVKVYSVDYIIIFELMMLVWF